MRRLVALLTAGVATVLLVVVEGGFAAPDRAAGTRLEGVLRDCRSRGEGRAPITLRPTSNDVRIGPLVLGNVRGPRSGGSTGQTDWPFARKAPVLLPARSRVVLAIAPEAATRAAFQHRGGWVAAVRFTACYERVKAWSYRGTVGRWTFFPFAIATTERAACVPMELWIEGQPAPVRRLVPLGRRDC